MNRISTFCLTVLGVFTLATPIVSAEWSQDPTVRTPVCTADYAQYDPRLVAVDDGFVVTWRDQRRENTHVDVYAQKFSIDGEMLWTENGRVIAAGPAGILTHTSQASAGLTDDGNGGALIAWNDYGYQGLMTRVDADEVVAWGTPGEPIQSPDTAVPTIEYAFFSDQWDFAADSEGGVFSPVGTWIGRFDADGELRTDWFDDPQDNQPGDHVLRLVPVVESGGKDGVIVVWPQGSLYFTDSILTRKLVDPETSWPSGLDNFDDMWGQAPLYDPDFTIRVCRLAAVPDGSGGVIAAWIDNRVRTVTDHYRVYAQRLDADGNPLWPDGGVEVSGDVTTYSCYWWSQLEAATDGNGGVVIAWNDDQNVLRAQRLDANGAEQWTADGVVVATDAPVPYSPLTVALARATDGNAILLYNLPSYYGRPQELVAQKLSAADGTFLWNEGWTVFQGCIPNSVHDYANMVSDGHGGAAVAFATCGEQDIYAHRLEESLPDLTVESIKAPRMLRPDKPITVRVTIGNVGNAGVSGTYMVSLYVDNELLKEAGLTDGPAAGEETVVTLSGVRIPDLPSGNHSLEAIADTYSTISESSEENNTASINVRMK